MAPCNQWQCENPLLCGVAFNRSLIAKHSALPVCNAVLVPCSPADPIAHPPYAVRNFGSQAALVTKTITPTALLAGHGNTTSVPGAAGNVLMYHYHNLYALSEARATHAAMVNITAKRPFLLSRQDSLLLWQLLAHKLCAITESDFLCVRTEPRTKNVHAQWQWGSCPIVVDRCGVGFIS